MTSPLTIRTAEQRAAAKLHAERKGLKAWKRAVNYVLSRTPVQVSPVLAAAMPEAPSFLVALDQYVATLDPYDPIRLMRSDVTQYERLHPDVQGIVDLLQLTDEAMDDIMRQAVAFEAA